ncbi:MAG TPA: helicase C-terminal domain-containing protein [Hydrogenophaga sp.]|uniref:helicase C-terminal domain-containing protein n=1 Tax=Hydrogenophaga sp. TaxID=1904254 RepID=UPI002CCF9338|nr:helicase C-terminal domain-containing protein [Hydrogenophaga sp.]HMN94559.1 helicase C-terminal domain-containing protein [Hydrogenophaga sp.]
MNAETRLVEDRPDDAPLGVVAVRALCDFAARTGDLDLRFTPSPSGSEGVAGHSEVTARRDAAYQREVALSMVFQGLRVQGRADGWDPDGRRLEEIKTHRGDPQRIGANQRALHRAQAMVYGHMLCAQLGLDGLDVVIVYFNIDTQQETPLPQWHSATELREHFEALCARYRRWALAEREHRAARDAHLRSLRFPFDSWRQGQRELAEAVYRTHSAGRVLMAQAPTGIGKTLATLFAALKAAPATDKGVGQDKLFYLTAKTTGRQLALDALLCLTEQGAAPLRVLERLARDKACEHPDKACHGESCPLARGFYDRLPAARESAARVRWLDKTTLREQALAHDVCPYYLGQEMLRWCDVAVGDVNHFFDHGAAWHALTEANDWRVSLLVDEAHNLIERARAMHGATLEPGAFQALRKDAPAALKKPLDKLQRRWSALAKTQAQDHEVLSDLPGEFIATLQGVCADIGDHLAQHPQDAVDGPLMRWWFDALHFLRVAESFADHSFVDLTREAHSRSHHPVLAIRNVVPGPLLQSRWGAAHGVTLFSATLAPMDYVADLLGLPADTLRLDVPSPFHPAQLAVRIAPRISTRWADRLKSLDALVQVMATQYRAEPGNYLAFFSSFDYLQQALDRLQQRHGDISVWAQSRGMAEPEREAFLQRFTEDGAGIGFAVLGGAFGEGIDLPGRRLIGAFIATLGLPQINPVNEQMRARLQTRFGRGHDYAYLFPGLQKVVQAAGRVIRTEQDHGTVWLLDDRYARAEVRRWLPAWWQAKVEG